MNNKIKIVQGEKSWIESAATEQLKKVAKLQGIIKAVGLPDLHPGKTPVGASFISKDIIYPHIVGNDIGCGMALFSTGFKKQKFKQDKVINKLYRINGIENVDITEFLSKADFPLKKKLGTIGSGNHFAEFQEIDNIYDSDAMEEIKMDKGNIYLLVHSGSRSYGEQILRKYIEEHSCQNGLKAGSAAFNEYFSDHDKAVEYAILNRELIAYRILTTVNAKENIKLLDSVHNSVTKKKIEEEVYIHRKGAAPSDVGYVVIAGTRGSRSYIVKPEANLGDYAFSISHGAGRKWARLGCKEKLENLYSRKAVRQVNTIQNLICKNKNIILEEAPEAYKDIERVIEDMLEFKMIKLVASLKPVITYKI